MLKHKIYPSITTSTRWLENGWRKKIQDVRRLKLKEVCLFPTMLSPQERKELVKEIEKSSIVEIPLVHLRSDSTPE